MLYAGDTDVGSCSCSISSSKCFKVLNYHVVQLFDISPVENNILHCIATYGARCTLMDYIVHVQDALFHHLAPIVFCFSSADLECVL